MVVRTNLLRPFVATLRCSRNYCLNYHAMLPTVPVLVSLVDIDDLLAPHFLYAELAESWDTFDVVVT